MKYINPKNNFTVEFEGDEMSSNREELLRDEYLTGIKESLNSHRHSDLLSGCVPIEDWDRWDTDFEACTNKEEYDKLKWGLVSYIAENEFYHDFLGE